MAQPGSSPVGGAGHVQDPIVVHVYVRDEVRGRQALLWDYPYKEELECVDVAADDPIRPDLPEGSRMVGHVNTLPLYSPALPSQALQAHGGWYVSPEAGQEGVAEAEKLWRMAGGDEDNYDDHDSFFFLELDDDVTYTQLALFIQGLLDLQ
jgi:hypothetical protein